MERETEVKTMLSTSMTTEFAFEHLLGAGTCYLIEELMLDIMFHLPTSKKAPVLNITKTMVMESELKFQNLKYAVGE